MRFGRKKDGPPEETGSPVGEVGQDDAQPAEAPSLGGPYDLDDVEYDEEDASKVHLGSLIVTGRPGVELRLQVDETSGAVAAALLVSQEGAVELRAFAAPRNAPIWDDVRKSIAAEVARQGGTATEADGPWGTELHLMVTGQDENGQTVTQPSRIAGISGPRWLLRATFYGPAVQADPENLVEQTVRDLIVVRGTEARAPGEFLPLVLPPSAQRLG